MAATVFHLFPSQRESLPLGVVPILTENFLLQQEGVLDASCWFESGALHAHVTLSDYVDLSPRQIKALCADELGLHQTPRKVIVILARGRGETINRRLAA